MLFKVVVPRSEWEFLLLHMVTRSWHCQVLDHYHLNKWVMVSCFNLNFLNGKWCWASFHMPFFHLYFLFGEVSVQVFSYRCVCNIDCSGYSFNPVCASDGSSYNNPCFVREASCIKQEQIDIRHLGHCTGKIPFTYSLTCP